MRLALAIIASLVFGLAQAAAQTYAVKGVAAFDGTATAVGTIKVPGTGAPATGTATVKDGNASGTFEVDLSKLETGNSLRDSHMHDTYLETKKHPTARLELAPVAIGEKMEWSGTLTLKGVSKPVKGTASFKAGALDAEFELDLSQWREVVPEPIYKIGPVVAARFHDKVLVRIAAEAK